MTRYLFSSLFFLLALPGWQCSNPQPGEPRRLEILLLGHNSEHHFSEKFAEIISGAFFKEGINISYTPDPDDLNDANLSKYDGLMIYANHDHITPSQEQALLKFVRSGKGLIPVHCASFCFQNSPAYIEMVGGQFASHQTDSFQLVMLDKENPILHDVPAFTTFDETYVHDKLAKDIHVLTERVDGDHHEPYTWIKSYGNGRVFYTAYGHDEHTWNNPGFLKLLKNGVLWAVGDAARANWEKLEKPAPSYTDAKIPNYERREGGFRLQAPLTVQESLLLTQVPPDFRIELFASEPDIVKPIAMAWDEKGRLWIVETIDYPNTVREVKGEGIDRIKICEDTDGDGKADKFTVFAEGLNIPTSIAFANGGVIVAQAPDFLFLKDTDGDDIADTREKIITGWGVFDTHAGPSSLKYGLDNMMWGAVGYSGFSGRVAGTEMKFGQGLYRFTADGSHMEFMGATSNNTWGLGFSENFDVFASTANNTHSAFMGIPAAYLARINEPAGKAIEKIDGHYRMHVVTQNLRQVDVHNGFTAAAGHNLYTARNFPQRYWNRIAFVNEPTGRVIHESVLESSGAGYKERDGWNFVASADEWFGPVQAEVGPDGAVWVLDWYNFIIQHNPTPEGFENGPGNAYINPLRDRTHGRIYRIVYKGAAAPPIKQLDKQNPGELIKGLKSDNMFWRTIAQRLIVESEYVEVAPALYEIIQNRSVDGIGVNAPAVHALWTLQGLGLLNGDHPAATAVVVEALKHPAAGVRKAAAQVLPRDKASATAIIQAGLTDDPDLHTRLAVFLALADMPAFPDLAAALHSAAAKEQNGNDHWLKDALQIALATQQTNQLSSDDQRIPGGIAAKPDQVVTIGTVQNAMKFDLKTFTVKTGSVVEIVFENTDFMQHNLLILQPGSIEKVGAEADKLAQDPKGMDKQYVPEIPDVLFATKLVNPEQRVTLRFTAPASAGDYPFICSFPGHWRIMNGIMKVIH